MLHDLICEHACMLHASVYLAAEVSCRDTVRQARVTRNPSKGMRALAQVSSRKSENGAHRVFREFGQSLDIAISKTDLPTKSDYPYIKLGSWLKFLVEFDALDQLTGVEDVKELGPVLAMFLEEVSKRSRRTCHIRA